MTDPGAVVDLTSPSLSLLHLCAIKAIRRVDKQLSGMVCFSRSWTQLKRALSVSQTTLLNRFLPQACDPDLLNMELFCGSCAKCFHGSGKLKRFCLVIDCRNERLQLISI